MTKLRPAGARLGVISLRWYPPGMTERWSLSSKQGDFTAARTSLWDADGRSFAARILRRRIVRPSIFPSISGGCTIRAKCPRARISVKRGLGTPAGL